MKKVDIFFIALAVFGLIVMFKAEFLSVSGNAVSACIDSDNGIEPSIGGNLIGFDDSSKKDTCVNGTTLIEYFCVGDGSNGLAEEIYCDFGCDTKEGRGVCLNRNEFVEGNKLFGTCTDACYFKGVCLPFGTRIKDGTYCDTDSDIDIQLLSGETCFNNYQCRSNLCIAENCVSKETFDKFLESLEE